ncbi:DNA gyrase inhibitor YacG [Comamonas serinivorans]|uniref:DNA gyrase inhibitor YacG n=1 Tax=Comamonas serinivorans TaxID=1082851 RepID=A0A1Y0ER09_9BURK|nr:DNA gyrase inhibitor YacG [Comamonas serinivorans]ARU05938.1 DNA gyrase inhibitor YacG [Comamonas serinivorans]
MAAPRPSPPTLQPRTVTCPGCGGPSRYASDNPYRPFCSARCKGVDLGAWASEQFRVPVDATPDPDAPPADPNPTR